MKTTPFGQAMTIARRDFLSIVATPTFLIFLLAPLFMLGFGLVGGVGASSLGESALDKAAIVAIVAPADRAAATATDERLRSAYSDDGGPPELSIVAAEADPAAQARRVANDGKRDVYAVLYGPLERPTILERNKGATSGRYLASLAEATVELQRNGAVRSLTEPTFASLGSGSTRNSTRQGLGFGAVFVIFILTLLTAGQTVSTLAEEKGNKVIEILAAAAPLEAVFAGKLIAMLGVAILFVAFWLTLGIGGSIYAATQFADQAATMAANVPAGSGLALADFAPAIGFPAFLGFGVVYFLLAFLLLGSVFLGIGALASTMREIQMLSLPITIFQVAMFGLGSAAANNPGSTIATFAQIFPFSSPFAMAARGATDGAIWPHLAAIAWQALWVAIVLWLAVRLFRYGVLKSGPGWRLWRKSRA